MRILLVEDEHKIAQFVAQILREQSYSVDVAGTGKEARDYFGQVEYDLIILDVMLPDDDGIKICHDFKKEKSKIPIMLLTTMHQIHDKVRGLDSGANDYVTKPFHSEEFVARVRALLRKNEEKMVQLKCADLELDLIKRCAFREDKIIKLTTKEFALLEYFLRNIGRPLSRSQITEHVWDIHFDPESNIVDVYVKLLRKKIDGPFIKKLIKTIVGHGYVINDE